jgi:UDP-N-acetylglucosamine 2-epimerase (non-hydrolysing)/GDP/UDP-N,N'-diacetylbacillosamine 2-epimerase (hydrolysing)
VLAGAASLDNLHDMRFLSVAELEQKFTLDLREPPLVVTFHPVTLEADQTEKHVEELLAALHDAHQPVVFTSTNADTRNHSIARAIDHYVAAHANARQVASFGTQGYFSLLRHAKAMVGNSSSGIVEAATFLLPVVNVGNRQAGRFHGRNVINVDATRENITGAIRTATSAAFRASLEGLQNPYGDGRAGEIIVETLRTCPLGSRLLIKHFHEVTQ